MGQYHYTVNLDKREFLNPHKLGAGLKLLEQVGDQGGIGDALIILLACSNGRGGGDFTADPWVGHWAGDRIAIVGDYTEDTDLRGPLPLPASEIYSACCNGKGFTDITDALLPVIKRECEVEVTGTGWRQKVVRGAEVQPRMAPDGMIMIKKEDQSTVKSERFTGILAAVSAYTRRHGSGVYIGSNGEGQDTDDLLNDPAESEDTLVVVDVQEGLVGPVWLLFDMADDIRGPLVGRIVPFGHHQLRDESGGAALEDCLYTILDNGVPVITYPTRQEALDYLVRDWEYDELDPVLLIGLRKTPTKAPEPSQELLTVKEIAKELRVSPQGVTAWIRRGDLPAFLLGSRAGYRVTSKDLDAFVKARIVRKAKDE